MRRGKGTLVFVVYLILGLYLINSAFLFVKIPAVILSVDKWIGFLGGLFLILGGINFLRLKRYVP